MKNIQAFIDIISTLIKEGIDTHSPVSAVFGEVESTSPLKIKLDSRMALEESDLILSTNVKEKKITVDEVEYTIIEALEVGEKVIILKFNDGQSFYVLDRIE